MNINYFDDKYYIDKALYLANKSLKNGDVPIGAVLVAPSNSKNANINERLKKCKINKDLIFAKGFNKRNKNNDATSHAEIIAISNACKKLGDFRLDDFTMYVTLEPCPMCAGAILQSRIKKLVIGTRSYKSGSFGSIINILDNDNFNHKVMVSYLDDINCKNIIKNFFGELRNVKYK